jgi:hypothetical protein
MAGRRFLAGVERQYCSLYLPRPLVDQTLALGQRTGLTRNAIVSLALDDYLQRHGQPVVETTTDEDAKVRLHSL